MNERLRRVTDLFVEGAELYMGLDDAGQPVVVWVNKLNSFEVEEARRDGVSARGLRVSQLGSSSDECKAMRVAMTNWTPQKLAEKRAEQMSDTLYLRAINDIEVAEEWREKIELVRRGQVLLDDASAPPDDPRWAEINQANIDYIGAVRMQHVKVIADQVRDLLETPRRDLEEEYIEAWRNEMAMDVFIAERRVTELYYALRDCKAIVEDGDGEMLFKHDGCDHSVRLLSSRAEVKGLPEELIEKAIAKLGEVTVDPRTAGNSAAPASSSASLEQPSEAEAVSETSIPVEMVSGAHMT